MEKEQVDRFERDIVELCGLDHGFTHPLHRVDEHLPPVHLREVASGVEEFLAHEPLERHPRRRQPEFLGPATVGVEMGRKQVLIGGRVGHLHRLHHHRSGTVTEQHGHVAALGGDVESFAVNLCADHQHPIGEPGPQELVGDRRGVDEAGALLADIDRRHPGAVEFLLDEARGAGELVVGTQGGHDDHVDVVGGDAGIGHGRVGRFHGEIRGRGVGVDPAALLDPGPLGDPVVRSVHQPAEVVVADDPGRHIRAETTEASPSLHPPPPSERWRRLPEMQGP